MRQISLYFHTLRYLKVKQLIYRIFYLFYKVKPCKNPTAKLRGLITNWPIHSHKLMSTKDGRTFDFLGNVASLDEGESLKSQSKLWLYNLHYQDDLNASDADFNKELCATLVDQWIEENPAISGIGWEPYCLSLRAVNWVKWLSRCEPSEVKQAWVLSLATQADALNKQIEYHILGNHLFTNAKALVFMGAFFGGVEGDKWLQKGLVILDEEINEQYLSDGAHFELSPMYQTILLADIVDLICLANQTNLPALKKRSKQWQQVFQKGIEWLENMSHPDGEISFFNDAAFAIGPTIADLKKYAVTTFAYKAKRVPFYHGQWHLLAQSGYAISQWASGHKIIADVGHVGPDYQPGHAHADTLSCELSLFGERVFVNSGISHYGVDAQRLYQRSTRAHNTLEVDGMNSSQIWAGFRVAKRAKPLDVSVQNQNDCAVLRAGHDGYKQLYCKALHHRTWSVHETKLQITDTLDGSYDSALAYWHLHPSLSIELVGENSFEVMLSKGNLVRLHISGGSAYLGEGSWHPEFGRSIPNQKLIVQLTGYEMTLSIEWSER